MYAHRTLAFPVIDIITLNYNFMVISLSLPLDWKLPEQQCFILIFAYTLFKNV